MTRYMTKADWLALHADFRAVIRGRPYALQLVPGEGTCLVPVSFVSEEFRADVAEEPTPYARGLRAGRLDRTLEGRSDYAWHDQGDYGRGYRAGWEGLEDDRPDPVIEADEAHDEWLDREHEYHDQDRAWDPELF